jgi:hypothetical protein
MTASFHILSKSSPCSCDLTIRRYTSIKSQFDNRVETHNYEDSRLNFHICVCARARVCVYVCEDIFCIYIYIYI